MLDIPVSQDAAHRFALAVYQPYHTSNRGISTPLTKTKSDLDPNCLASWLSAAKIEDVDDRHHCGLYTYMVMTAAADPNALRERYFDAAYQHPLRREKSWPDKGVIKAGFERGHLAFARRDDRTVFYITPVGQAGYIRWRDHFRAEHFDNLTRGNFPNLQAQL